MAKCDHVHFNGSYKLECKVYEAMRTFIESTICPPQTFTVTDMQMSKGKNPIENVFCRAHASILVCCND